jgi:hypothetical protein
VEGDLRLNYTKKVVEATRNFAHRQGSASMPKVLCVLGMVVAVLLLLVFGLDLATEFPFGGASAMVSIGFIVSSLVLIYLSWSAFREQV